MTTLSPLSLAEPTCLESASPPRRERVPHTRERLLLLPRVVAPRHAVLCHEPALLCCALKSYAPAQ